MSTKAIREALDWLENYLGHEPEAQEARRAARAEVEAIERAARALSDDAKGLLPKNSYALSERDKAHRLMWSIDQQEK